MFLISFTRLNAADLFCAFHWRPRCEAPFCVTKFPPGRSAHISRWRNENKERIFQVTIDCGEVRRRTYTSERELALDKPEFTRYISMLFLIDWVRKIQIKHSFVPRAAARACNFTQQRVHWWVCIVDLNQPLASSEMIVGKHNLWRKKTVTNFSELLESEKGNHRLHLQGFNSFVICFTFYMFTFSKDVLAELEANIYYHVFICD